MSVEDFDLMISVSYIKNILFVILSNSSEVFKYDIIFYCKIFIAFVYISKYNIKLLHILN
jgi:hypothetical protein